MMSPESKPGLSVDTQDIDADCLGFRIGDAVVKVSGRYHPPGNYRGYITSIDGTVHPVVEHAYGMLHIYSEGQIAKEPAAIAGGNLHG